MWRWRRIAAVAALAVLGSGAPGHAAGQKPAQPARTGPVAYLVMDADTGAVLAERDSHKRWPPASMAKMMTVLIAMERVRDGSHKLDEPVLASAWASRIGGSQVFLAEGEVFTLGQLLEAIMVNSANDGSVAVAEHVAGSTDAFVVLMNERARSLGLADTTYQSVHGLPPSAGQKADLTSAYDLAVLGRELMRHPEVRQWAGTAKASFRNGTLEMMNTNHLVRNYPGATGLKTGYYREAGFSVTATATRNDLDLIAVVLGVERKKDCFQEAARLMNEAFAAYRVVAPAKRGMAVGDVPITGGADAAVKAIATDDLRVLVKRGEDKGVVADVRIPRVLEAPVRRDQAIGEVVVRRGDEELGRVPVVADRDVAATGWLGWLWNRGMTTASAAR